MLFRKSKKAPADIVLDDLFSADFIKDLSLQSVAAHLASFLRCIPAEHMARVKAIRPWSVFFDTAHFSLAGFTEASKRFGINLMYFASNYFAISFLVALYQIIRHPLLVVSMLGCACAAAGYKQLSAGGQRFVLGGQTIPDSRVYGFITGTSVFLFWITGGTSAVFWIVALCSVLIGAHGTLRDVTDTESRLRRENVSSHWDAVGGDSDDTDPSY